jgi:hypothetical protein
MGDDADELPLWPGMSGKTPGATGPSSAMAGPSTPGAGCSRTSERTRSCGREAVLVRCCEPGGRPPGERASRRARGLSNAATMLFLSAARPVLAIPADTSWPYSAAPMQIRPTTTGANGNRRRQPRLPDLPRTERFSDPVRNSTQPKTPRRQTRTTAQGGCTRSLQLINTRMAVIPRTTGNILLRKRSKHQMLPMQSVNHRQAPCVRLGGWFQTIPVFICCHHHP